MTLHQSILNPKFRNNTTISIDINRIHIHPIAAIRQDLLQAISCRWTRGACSTSLPAWSP